MNKKQLKRIIELSNIKGTSMTENKKIDNSTIELIKIGGDGNTYVIVREHNKYYIKQSETKSILTENDFDYIGGIQNKNKQIFKSFDDAVSRLNIMFNDINQRNGINENTNMVNFDFNRTGNGTYEIINEKRYVLKQPKRKVVEPKPEIDFTPQPETKKEEPVTGFEDFNFGGESENTDFEEGPTSTDDFDFGDGGENMEPETTDLPDFGDNEVSGDETPDDGTDPIKSIQKTTGKLGQQLRDVEDLSSDMQKYVVNSVLSALNLDTMSDSDRESIINKLENTEQKQESGVDFMSDEYLDDDRGGEPELEGNEEILLDNEIYGYLGFEDNQKQVDYMDDCSIGEGMSSWMKDEDNGGMGWTVGEGISYMDDEDGKNYVQELLDYDKNNDEFYRMNAPSQTPSKPSVKPDVRPERPSRPSKSPFSPPERIRPGEEPRPKARMRDYMAEPKPSTEPNPTIAPPTTRPERPSRPSKSPFTPPERIRPGEEPRPKAGYDDIEFS